MLFAKCIFSSLYIHSQFNNKIHPYESEIKTLLDFNNHLKEEIIYNIKNFYLLLNLYHLF